MFTYLICLSVPADHVSNSFPIGILFLPIVNVLFNDPELHSFFHFPISSCIMGQYTHISLPFLFKYNLYLIICIT
jgi:hypothetical protein